MNVQDSRGLRDAAVAVRQDPLNVFPFDPSARWGLGIVSRPGPS
jgi:hypothetical protein